MFECLANKLINKTIFPTPAKRYINKKHIKLITNQKLKYSDCYHFGF